MTKDTSDMNEKKKMFLPGVFKPTIYYFIYFLNF